MIYSDRFFLFRSKFNFYLYDKFTNSINKIDKNLFSEIQKENFDLNNHINIYEKSAVSTLLKQKSPKIKYFSEKKCYVSINLSSICNMNYSYCFKRFTARLEESTLEDIFRYITEKYFPNAEEYIFSVGYSSEALIDLNLINKLDELISKKEGFLLSETDFKNITPNQVLKELLNICKINANTSLSQNNPISCINSIIENINLQKFLSKKFLSTISPFYYNFLTYSQNLCKSKRVQLNRRIIEKLFNGKIKVFECKQYYTISFMTNGLIINNKIIKYLKSRVIKEIYVSLDGYKKIQDFQRKDLIG